MIPVFFKMWKKNICPIIFICLSLQCFSQQAKINLPDSALYLKYAENEIPGHEHQFYLVEIKNSASQQIKNNAGLLAVRKLSENLFVLDKDKLDSISSNRLFIKKITAANNLWKLSSTAEISRISPQASKKIFRFTISFKNNTFLEDLHKKFPALRQKISVLPEQKIMSFLSTYDQIEKLFQNDDRILFIDQLNANPREELATPGFDLSANKINIVHSLYPQINGAGQHVSIKEDYYDTTDIDIKNRLDNSPLASNNITDHANFMATIIAGGGNSIWYAKGVAWAANVSSSSFEQILPDPNTYYLQQGISVQNHSYGTLVDNDYGLNAVAFDKSANDNEGLVHVFSSGNSGTETSSSGLYSGINGFANLTGNFKMAKNIITVGAADSFGNIASMSSRGPAYDGRIKPDLVAFQKNGTSEAAALVSGTVLLLQQYYKEENNDSVLPSALAKAILINTADDINDPGPDYTTGFGFMNSLKAMETIKDHRTLSGIITAGGTQKFSFDIPANTGLLKVTLAWNDAATSPLAPKALVNDLDLLITGTAPGTTWQPWVLNPSANIDSLKSPAKRRRDSLNNVEQVSIENPPAGNYQGSVTGFNLPTGSQKYYVAYSWDTLNAFRWLSPTSIDFTQGGMQNVLRWESSITGQGDIEYTYASSPAWINAGSNIDLSKSYFYWVPPDTIVPVLLRMKIGNNYIYSDTFLVTKLLNPKVGFICGDSILVYWNKIQGINNYEVYGLGEKYMEPLLKVADTSTLVSKNLLTDKYIAIAPILFDGKTAPKSYAFDYTLQGSGCFINSFLANAEGNNASLTLSVGTLYHVASISFEKQTMSGFETIYSAVLNNQLEYTYEYHPLSRGITYFRAKIVLINGQAIYSTLQAVFYVEPGKYLLLPVPVKRNNDISVYTTIPDGEIISISDVLGRIILQKEIVFTHEVINTSSLQPGTYFYRISKKGLKVYSGRFIIL
jgi:hypothetical protein